MDIKQKKVGDLKKKHYIQMPFLLGLVLIIIFSFLLTCIMFVLQNNGVPELLAIFKKTHYITFILNFLPALLTTLILFFITNNFIFSMGFVSFLVILGSFLNRYKVELRQDPFMPWDISLGTEFVTILQGFDLSDFSMMFIFIGLAIVFGAVLLFFVRTKKINVILRVVLSVVFIGISFMLNEKVYKNSELYTELYMIGNVYNQVENFNSKGFLYSFIYNVNNNRLQKFDGYNKISTEKFIKKYDLENNNSLDNVVKPHIFVIMDEAFSEISDVEEINYEGYVDPLKEFKKIKEESVYGHIIVPNLGGGTADTEFDILTGINTRNFRGIPSSYRAVTKPVKALPSLLEKNDYENVAIHPGHAWFYNRTNVYNYFGFSEFITIEEFPEDLYKGMYVNETSAFNRIIKEFDDHLEKNNNKPFFNFCVTIQNHGPYPDKYLVDTNFNNELDWNPLSTNGLSNYIDGVIDSDRELKRLCDYLNKVNEPCVVLFFGDHLPALEQEVYETIVDSDESDIERITNRYSIPYIIWQNNSYKEILDLKKVNSEKGFSNVNKISSHYLGFMMLSLIGMEDLDPFIGYSMDMMKKYPVILENQYFDETYNLHDDMDSNEDITNYKYWQYYSFFDERR